MGVVADVERRLAELRSWQKGDDVPELRTSTMTHVVWAPDSWLPQVRRVLAGLAERHPARTLVLVPEPSAPDGVAAKATVRDFDVAGGREVLSEVVEIRLCGRSAAHPGSVVLPLLISDLPAFCRWRGEPDWRGGALHELTSVCDRLIVDSAEWRRPASGYARLVPLLDRLAVSDLAWRRSLPWRRSLADCWPGIRRAERLRVEGPRADALLLAGWLRTRLRRDVRLTVRQADRLQAVWVDGEPVAPPPGKPPSSSDLLSAELDTLGRDPVYERALRSLAR